MQYSHDLNQRFQRIRGDGWLARFTTPVVAVLGSMLLSLFLLLSLNGARRNWELKESLGGQCEAELYVNGYTYQFVCRPIRDVVEFLARDESVPWTLEDLWALGGYDRQELEKAGRVLPGTHISKVYRVYRRGRNLYQLERVPRPTRNPVLEEY